MHSEKVARSARAKAPKAIGAKEVTRKQTLGPTVEEEAKASAKQAEKERKVAKQVDHALPVKCPGEAMVASLGKSATNVEDQVISQKTAEHLSTKFESTKKSSDREPKNCRKISQSTTTNLDLASCANFAKMQVFLDRSTKPAEIEAIAC